MRELTFNEVDMVDGASFAEAVGAGLVGAGTVSGVAAALTVFPATAVGGVALFAGGFALGVALY